MNLQPWLKVYCKILDLGVILIPFWIQEDLVAKVGELSHCHN